MGSLVEVTVRGIAAGGSGVAELPDGRVVFVPRTAPGDRASIRVEKGRARWAVGTLEEVLEPGEARCEPVCALYDRCGGCQLQHLRYTSQLEWKGRIVSDALERIGKLSDVDEPEVVPSPHETGYRTRITFTLRRLRGARLVAGFHGLGRPAHVVDVRGECLLPRPKLIEVWLALRARWGPGARFLPAGGRLRLTLRAENERTALVVDGGEPGSWGDDLATALPELAAIWHRPAGASGTMTLVAGDPDASPAPAFIQVNPEVASSLVDHVVQLAGFGDRAVDAYCGAGEYARRLVTRGWHVTAIERDPAACAAARSETPDGFEVREGTVEALLPGALPADLLVLNPPRTGLTPEVLAAIDADRPARVIYVSCDPATLARDLSTLSHAYALEAVRCFDLFPQTASVETVVALRVRGA